MSKIDKIKHVPSVQKTEVILKINLTEFNMNFIKKTGKSKLIKKGRKENLKKKCLNPNRTKEIF